MLNRRQPVYLSNLWDCGGERVAPNTWLIDANSKELPYLPEKWLAEWLLRRAFEAPAYAFAKTGVEPLRAALPGAPRAPSC